MKLFVVKRPSVALIHSMVGAFLVIAASSALVLTPVQASASHKVYSPYVEKGELEIEVRGHVDQDGARKNKYEVGYGFTDWWFSSVFAEYEQLPGSSLNHSATSWENIFQLTEPGKHWLDAGFYLEYESPVASGPAKLETKLLLEKAAGRYVNTANLVMAREVGNGASSIVELEYAWRTKYKLKPEFEPGIELYGAAGTLAAPKLDSSQSAQIGPVATGKFHLGGRSAVVYELGYLFGLNNASPSGSVKWLIEYEYVL
ncbi:MAG: hypothetical protein ACWGOV_10800 [Acidiferrobacterales bacterium]